VNLQLRSLEWLEGSRGVFLGNPCITVVGSLTLFIGHFEENQVGELLQIVAVTDAVVAESGQKLQTLETMESVVIG